MSTDRDIAIRTMIGEAAGESIVGQAAVAHVLANRSRDKRWGGTISDVALAPKQFSAWNSGAGGNHLVNKYKPGDITYERMGKIYDAVMAGQIKDPTGGATHYFSPAGMKALFDEGSQSNLMPRWLQEETNRRGAKPTRIGGHLFTGKAEGIRVVDSGQVANDATPQITRQMILQEIERRKSSQQPQITRQMVLDEIERRKAAQPPEQAPVIQPQSEQPQQESGGFVQGAMDLVNKVNPAAALGQGIGNSLADAGLGAFTKAGRMIVGDMQSGMQGVNPVSMLKEPAIGMLIDDGAGVVLRQEGSRDIPFDQLDQTKLVSMVNPEDGNTYVYIRTPELEESKLASAGRLLGYSAVAPVPKTAALAKPPNVQTAAKAIGVTPTLSMQSKAGSLISAAGEQVPTMSGRLRNDAARVSAEMAGASENIAASIGPGATQFDAGEALKRGAEIFTTKVKDTKGKLYDRVDQLVKPETVITTPKTEAALRELVSVMEKNPELQKFVGDTKWAKLLPEMGSDISWQAARYVRTEIGQSVGKIKGPLADVSEGKLKLLYGALTEDLNAAATAAGPEALAAWKRANTYTRASSERIESAFAKVLKADSPEAAYARVMQLTTDKGASANIQALSRLKKSMPKEDWAQVVATTIRRMGKATPGAQGASGDTFSASTFLTNWNKMSPQAKAMFTQGGIDPIVKTQLDSLVRVLERAKAAGIDRNTSNTGNVLLTGTLGAGLYVDPISTATVAGASHISARAMTNQTFLRALNEFAATGSPKRMNLLAASRSPLAIEAEQVLRLSGVSEVNTRQQTSASTQARD